MDIKYYKNLAAAYATIKEGTFIIPEEVPANERTAFHGAAAAAHKAGKTHFNFGGKKHPVTMKNDTAKAIADETQCPKCKGEGCDHCDGKGTHEAYKSCSSKSKKEGYEDFDKVLKKKKKTGEDDPESKAAGNEIEMNPKTENVRSADKKPEVYVAPDGKKHTRMVPVDKEVVKTKESTDMSIRQKLMAVLENRGEHYKSATQPETMDDTYKGAGAKKMKDDNKDTGEYLDLEKKSHDDASKAGRVTKPSAKNATDKDTKGDKNIINPVKDTTKAGKGDPSVKESFSRVVRSVANAYKSMYEEVDVDHHMDHHEKHTDLAKKHSDAAKDARDAGASDHAVHHMMAADLHRSAAKKHDMATSPAKAAAAKSLTRKAMAASQKADALDK